METADPRDQVTQTAFQIMPDLLGVELAAPWRRALALGIDLILAAIISSTGGGAIAGIAAAILFVLVAMRTPSKSRPRRVGRTALVTVGALILFGVATGLIDDATRDDDEAMTEVDRQHQALESDLELEATDAASKPDSVWTSSERAEAALALRAYADAVTSGDATLTDSLRLNASRWASGAEVVKLNAEIERLDGRRRRVASERDELQDAVENPSYFRALLPLAADIGLPLGWVAFYFTLTLAWWGGYTPGKRLLGIRVVRLDGKRLGLWTAFERFGGYAAGVVTGLLGFAQILWDPNRQGVQDKIAGTAVVRMKDAQTPRRVS